ncbi:Kcnh2 [Symbiodinium sp. CCMP2456]|nr:Kcnh2 [Symbiodinium sp. CCMP2456]
MELRVGVKKVRKLLAVHDVHVDCRVAKHRNESGEEYPSRIHSDFSNYAISAAPSLSGVLHEPPAQVAALIHSESLPSIEPCQVEPRSRQRTVSFIEGQEGGKKDMEAPGDFTSEASVASQRFDMHSAWRRLGEEQVSKATRCQSSLPSDSLNLRANDVSRQPSMARLWAVVAIISLVLHAAALPLAAFLPREIHWVDAISLTTALFWMITLPLAAYRWTGQLSSSAAAFRAAAVEMLLNALLLLDLGIPLPLELKTLCQGLQLTRLRHLPKLYALSGLPRSVRRWNRQHTREAHAISMFLINLISCAMFLHYTTCLWFAVGSLPDGWIAGSGLETLSVPEQYLKTVEWALSRMPASRTTENMLLSTQTERILALLATGFAILIGSVFTSVITNELSDIRRAHRTRSEAQHQVEDYLSTFPVSWELESGMRQYLQRSTRTALVPSKEDMDKVLPEYLYRELCREALSPVLAKHEFFGRLLGGFVALQYDLCHKALSDWNLSPHETLFSAGPTCTSMLIVARGTIWYRSMRGMSTELVSKPVVSSSFRRKSWASILPIDGRQPLSALQLEAGDWLCEAGLWTSWHYMGKAMSETPATLLCLSHQALLELVSVHKEVRNKVYMYARVFVRELNDMEEDEVSDLRLNMGGPACLHNRSCEAAPL